MIAGQAATQATGGKLRNAEAATQHSRPVGCKEQWEYLLVPTHTKEVSLPRPQRINLDGAKSGVDSVGVADR